MFPDALTWDSSHPSVADEACPSTCQLCVMTEYCIQCIRKYYWLMRTFTIFKIINYATYGCCSDTRTINYPQSCRNYLLLLGFYWSVLWWEYYDWPSDSWAERPWLQWWVVIENCGWEYGWEVENWDKDWGKCCWIVLWWLLRQLN